MHPHLILFMCFKKYKIMPQTFIYITRLRPVGHSCYSFSRSSVYQLWFGLVLLSELIKETSAHYVQFSSGDHL